MPPAPTTPPGASPDRPIDAVATSIAAFVGYFSAGPIATATRVASFTDLERDFGGLSRVSLASYAVHQFFVNGGRDAWIIRTASGDTPLPAGEVTTALPGATDLIAALSCLDAVDLFNVLCVPDTERLSDADAALVMAAAKACVVRRRAIYVVDLPQRDAARDQAGAVETWLDAHPQLRSANAALYFPRPELADPLDRNQPRVIPASGTIAGLFARVDAARGVWKAPAGRDAALQGVVGLERRVSEAQNERLAALGVNCLRIFGSTGPVAWGARTLAGAQPLASPDKYLPVVRLGLHIEESVIRGTRLEPGDLNGEPLWSRLRLRVGTFMHRLFTDGALQGLTPREAFLVKCDSDTTSADDIANGVVNIVVGFAPLKPAEFVLIRIQQLLHLGPDDPDPRDAAASNGRS